MNKTLLVSKARCQLWISSFVHFEIDLLSCFATSRLKIVLRT